jgi:hypothetical protein
MEGLCLHPNPPPSRTVPRNRFYRPNPLWTRSSRNHATSDSQNEPKPLPSSHPPPLQRRANGRPPAPPARSSAPAPPPPVRSAPPEGLLHDRSTRFLGIRFIETAKAMRSPSPRATEDCHTNPISAPGTPVPRDRLPVGGRLPRGSAPPSPPSRRRRQPESDHQVPCSQARNGPIDAVFALQPPPHARCSFSSYWRSTPPGRCANLLIAVARRSGDNRSRSRYICG